MSNHKDVLLPFLIGALLHAGMWAGVGWLYSVEISRIEVDDGFVTISMPWLNLLQMLLPGLAVGFLCKNRPLAIGFTAVVVAHLVMYPFSWHPIVRVGDPPLVVQALEAALHSGVFGAVAAAAGFYLASRKGASNPLRRSP